MNEQNTAKEIEKVDDNHHPSYEGSRTSSDDNVSDDEIVDNYFNSIDV